LGDLGTARENTEHNLKRKEPSKAKKEERRKIEARGRQYEGEKEYDEKWANSALATVKKGSNQSHKERAEHPEIILKT